MLQCYALISRVVLLSQNVKTAHSRYKDLLGNNVSHAVPVIMLLTFVSEKQRTHFNRSLRHGTEMRHRNLRSDSVLVRILSHSSIASVCFCLLCGL